MLKSELFDLILSEPHDLAILTPPSVVDKGIPEHLNRCLSSFQAMVH
jgi:hypothetical protein